MKPQFLKFSMLVMLSSPQLPHDWYQLPEDVSSPERLSIKEDTSEDPGKLAPVIEKIFDTTGKSVDRAIPPQQTPWHLEYFTTDLSVTAQGLLGLLTLKGTPAIQAFWRHQAAPPAQSLDTSYDGMVTQFQAGDNPVEPLIQAVLATGKFKKPGLLRRHLQDAATQFQAFVEVLEHSSGSSWWVSGFRVDLLVDASGTLLPVGTTVGGDLRLRFEWKRSLTMYPVSRSVSPDQVSLRQFVSSMEHSLEDVSAEASDPKGFEAYTFRVGI